MEASILQGNFGRSWDTLDEQCITNQVSVGDAIASLAVGVLESIEFVTDALKNYINVIEAGKTDVKQSNVRKIARTLKVEISTLIMF